MLSNELWMKSVSYPQRVVQKANLSFKNKFPYISVIVKPATSDLAHSLGLPRPIIKSHLEEKVGLVLN